jgi:hypothetical protein
MCNLQTHNQKCHTKYLVFIEPLLPCSTADLGLDSVLDNMVQNPQFYHKFTYSKIIQRHKINCNNLTKKRIDVWSSQHNQMLHKLCYYVERFDSKLFRELWSVNQFTGKQHTIQQQFCQNRICCVA